MKEFPQFKSGDMGDVEMLLREIVRERRTDIKFFDNLNNVFMRGRKVAKIPSGASDIAVTDRVGDFNYSATYLYICVDNAGTAEWRRVALSSW